MQDIRKALEDKDLDAISIATPNHWHALMTIWACQAGKDVYVEKPCSHNVHEGRIAVEMARKHKRIVQHGTQSRSSQSWADLRALAKSGKLGKLLVSRGCATRTAGPAAAPAATSAPSRPRPRPRELDFNLWLGPAQEQPYHENLVHYNWHWFWDFGNGDIGNQGVHQMDIARWVIPGATLPKSGHQPRRPLRLQRPGRRRRTRSVSVFDFGETQLIFEVRGLKTPALPRPERRQHPALRGGRGRRRQVLPEGQGRRRGAAEGRRPSVKRGGDHFGNFIACVRSRDAAKLNADIEVGHDSSGLCHLANICYRLGKDEAYDPKLGQARGQRVRDRGAGPDGRAPEGQRHQVRRQEPARRPEAGVRRQDREVRERRRGERAA